MFFAQNKSGGKSITVDGQLTILNRMPYSRLYSTGGTLMKVYLVFKKTGEEVPHYVLALESNTTSINQGDNITFENVFEKMDSQDYDQLVGIDIQSTSSIFGEANNQNEEQDILPLTFTGTPKIAVNGQEYDFDIPNPKNINLLKQGTASILLENPLDISSEKSLDIKFNWSIKTRGILHIYTAWDSGIHYSDTYQNKFDIPFPNISPLRFVFMGEDITYNTALNLMTNSEVYKVDIQQNWFGGQGQASGYKDTTNGANSCDYNLIYSGVQDKAVLQLNTRKVTTSDTAMDVWKLESAWFIYAYADYDKGNVPGNTRKITNLPVVRIEFTSDDIILYPFLTQCDAMQMANGITLPAIKAVNFGTEDFLTVQNYNDEIQVNKQGYRYDGMAAYPNYITNGDISDQELFNWVKWTGHLSQESGSQSYNYNLPFRWGIYNGILRVQCVQDTVSQINSSVVPDENDPRLIKYDTEDKNFEVPNLSWDGYTNIRCQVDQVEDYYLENDYDLSEGGSSNAYQGLLYIRGGNDYPSYTLSYKYEKEGYEYLPE